MEDLIAWLVEPDHGYPLIFATLAASGFGVPIPEDIPLLAAGILSQSNGISIAATALVCGVAVLLRDSCLYGLGFRYGMDMLEHRWAARIVPKERIERIQTRLRKHGPIVVFIGRFLPGLRGAVFFSAGTARIHPAVFIGVDSLAALISIPIWVWLGAAFADNFDRLLPAARQLRVGLFAGALVAVLLILFGLRIRRRLAARVLEENPGEPEPSS